MSDGSRPTIHVVAAFTTDADGRILVVRKAGSEIFMQPGGKPEPGEQPVEALVRELAEELLIDVDPDDLAAWGRFEADAANEPGHHLVADVFALRLDREVTAAAEIAEARWFTRDEARDLGDRLAPLARRMLELPPTRSQFRPFRFTEPIETARLRLRPITVNDVDAFHEYQSREDVARFMLFEPRSREEMAAKVAEWSSHTALERDGDYLEIPVELRTGGRMIGHLYLSLRSVDHLTAEIGWGLHPDFQGQGFAEEGARALLQLAFERMRLHRVVAELDPRNDASIALCRRLGMREEAHFRQDMWFKGDWADTGIYAVLAEEFSAR
ncbi:GNAT family N-acetyltransferase [Aeromicrobium sp. zg-636]|uniref:GNAT family N-acetyltransferase n=1 Tax=Aeromicrobium senzhongii TaxID=2663859 RepID=A0A8I0EVM5_9ACTN|nr:MULTISPECIES: GNAT family N-acetyltransferase [Aeromicrobium]MBC9225905.1 GNAT family N-acetyltransferase [Aeromicrobium senzhongii]